MFYVNERGSFRSQDSKKKIRLLVRSVNKSKRKGIKKNKNTTQFSCRILVLFTRFPKANCMMPSVPSDLLSYIPFLIYVIFHRDWFTINVRLQKTGKSRHKKVYTPISSQDNHC